jgi:two-component system OmpR family response regulator
MTDRKRVLIVEDEAGLADLLRVNLEAEGFETAIARDGMEALRLHDEFKPHAVTLDLNLPHVTGFRLFEVFRKDDPSLPIIAVTAFAPQEGAELARRGITGFMTKPIDFPRLAAMLRRATMGDPPAASE